MKVWKNRIRMLVVSLAAVLALMAAPAQVFAAVPIQTDADCSLNVVFAPEGVKCTDVEFRAYKVASVTPACAFVVDSTFADQTVLSLLADPDDEAYSLIASTLAGVVAAEGAVAPDYTAVTNAEGVASFASLETGLYLISGNVFHGFEVFYTPQTYLVCIPERLDGDVWNYAVTSEVKWEKRPDAEPITLEAVKVWTDSATNLHADGSVVVELYKNDDLYDTQVLNKDNEWTYVWEELYGGATWTLKEQTVTGYVGTVERVGDRFIVTNKPDTPPDYPPPPYTGLLWWPVPVLLAAGLLFVIIGVLAKRRGTKDEVR